VSVSLVAAVLTGASGAHTAARPITRGKLPSALVEIVVGPKVLGRISRRLFGSNLLWPYEAEGAFNPSTDSFYPAFVKEVRQLGVTSLHYPAGITARQFRLAARHRAQWQRLPDEPYGMQSAELSKICCTLDGPAPSTVGPDEFGELLDETGSVGDVVVNFATGTADEAADFVAYMTAPYGEQPSSAPSDPGFWAALRAKNGHPAPYNVPFWEVGNEQERVRAKRLALGDADKHRVPQDRLPVDRGPNLPVRLWRDDRLFRPAGRPDGRPTPVGLVLQRAGRSNLFRLFPPGRPRQREHRGGGRALGGRPQHFERTPG
jgi:hypothetical protein